MFYKNEKFSVKDIVLILILFLKSCINCMIKSVNICMVVVCVK